MDTVIAITGKDFVAVAADRHVAFSIVTLTHKEDKIFEIDGDKLLATSGETADRVAFGQYMQKNLHLNRLFRQGVPLGPRAAANFARTELAEALRKGPYQVNVVMAGYNKEDARPELYHIDWFGTLSQPDRCAHGYGAHFVLGLLDREFKPDMTLDEAMRILNLCFAELKARFLLSQSAFLVKVCSKDGIQVSNVDI